MVAITALWLPIFLSAVIVFLASFVLHMLVPIHRSDYRQRRRKKKYWKRFAPRMSHLAALIISHSQPTRK